MSNELAAAACCQRVYRTVPTGTTSDSCGN